MLQPEYRVGLRVLTREIGVLKTLRVVIPSSLSALGTTYHTDSDAGMPEITKADIKNHFNLLCTLYRRIKSCYGTARADRIMRNVMLEGGRTFFKGFRPLDADEDLMDFARVYQDFEKKNLVFHVVQESAVRFEIEVERCLVFEAFEELGAAGLGKWMCDIAAEYFRDYHPRMRYEKDRMIARGDETCHEVFTWH